MSTLGVFQHTESIYALKMQFKQKKIEIFPKFIWSDSIKKYQNVERLDNAILDVDATN
jgi:hypothetical protein